MSARPRAFLCVAALLIFVPAAWKFVRDGVPDVVFAGDGGLLEIRTLHAAHGTQLVGPYSRFQWNHPGPAFFYMALPLYEVFRERGPALNLFALLANAASALALVSVARRSGRDAFAFVVAGLLALFVAGTHFPLSTLWNPFTPQLPLALLSVLCARLATGDLDVLPSFVFLTSAIVQTHIGYVPVTFALCVLGAAFFVWHRVADGPLGARRRRRALWPVLAAILMLAVMWALPVYENVTARQGNLTRLWTFFTADHWVSHTWASAATTVAARLSEMPLAIARIFDPTALSLPLLEPIVPIAIASAEVAALIAALAWSLRHRARGVAALSLVALAEIAAAVVAVRSIRGGTYDYLTSWVALVGLVAFVAVGAAVVSGAARLVRANTLRAYAAAGATLILVVAFAVGVHDLPPPGGPDRVVEQLVRDVEAYVVANRVDHPVVSIVNNHWPIAVGIVGALYKHHVPVAVSDDYVFMFGSQLASDHRGEHPILLVGDQTLGDARRKDQTLVAAGGDTKVILEDPAYARRHLFGGKLRLLSASGAMGDPARVVDGVVPAAGERWDSPRSVVLGVSSVNELEVGVPEAHVNGLALWVDGNDTYQVRCNRADGTSLSLGTTPLPLEEIGMRRRLVFSDSLTSCRSISISPDQGDGFYSIGEIGFLVE